MAIGTVLEDHFRFIIWQVRTPHDSSSSLRREVAYHDPWCCDEREGGVSVSTDSQECDVTVMRPRHMSRITSPTPGEYSLLGICCHHPPPPFDWN